MQTGALLIIVNEQGKVLLQHKDGQAPTHPNHWTLFGGGIESGETGVAAVHRELLEELELSINQLQHFGVYNSNDVFLAHINKSAEDLKPRLHEGNALGYFSEAELQTIPVAEPHFKILRDYFADQK